MRIGKVNELLGFHPETVLLIQPLASPYGQPSLSNPYGIVRPSRVNPRACLCGVPVYASAQSLDFLTRTKNLSFPN
jgi:hypothetical protein